MSTEAQCEKRRERNRRWAQNHPDQVAANARRQYARRCAVINAAKDTPCADCGVKYPPYVMDLHHVEAKTVGLGEIGNTSIPRIVAEIAKCIVLCANCHRIRTYTKR